MHAILKILLLWTHLLHFNQLAIVEAADSSASVLPSSSANASNHLPFVDFISAEDSEVIEATTTHSSLEQQTHQKSTRDGRQLFYDPNQYFVPNFAMEGSKCITSRGLPGACVRFGSCMQQYYRLGRQFAYWTTVRQWPPQQNQLNNEICSFYDAYGRAYSGVCCSSTLSGFSGVMPPAIAPARPIPPPPQPAKDEPQRPVSSSVDESEDSTALDVSDIVADTSPDFQDVNDVVYDPIKDDGDAMPTPITYDDYRYQWPSQFAGQFGGVPQWPPPLPTHPPSPAASWPPPVPTHPPGHHYPTHPPSMGGAMRPTTVPTTVKTTKKSSTSTTSTRRPTTAVTTTTTRRPSYPGYPSYPSYPGYPSYRPPTTTTTTTTRRPTAALGGSSSGTSSNGLPLQCGIKNPTSPDQERIVGGINASPHEFPWIAVLFKSGKQFCGGTLITHNHILTAAHCVARMTSWDVAALTAHLGDYNIRTDFEVKHVERRIKRLVRHKGFEFSTLHNDIAILTLNEPIKFTYEIQPICLPTSTAQQSRSYSGHTATVAGWGSLRENGPQPSILQKVDIPIWTNTECARKYGHAAPGGIIESMICAGQAARDSCSGDSGGPLIVNEGARYTQIGIVSWGIGCGKGQYPGVYTRITSLLPWIYKNIK